MLRAPSGTFETHCAKRGAVVTSTLRMRRIPFAVALVGFAFLPAPARPEPQKKNAPAELTAQAAPLLDKAAEQTNLRAAAQNANGRAVALLDKAANLVNLRDGTSGLFRLKAHVRLYGLAHNAAANGTYTLDWAAPGRWREEFSFPGFTETSVAAGDKLWRSRNIPYRPLRVWQLIWLMDVRAHVVVGPYKESALQMSDELENGVKLTCIKNNQGPYTSERGCIETATGRPDFIELASPGITELYHYMDYAPFGDKVFPRTLRYSFGGIMDVEAKVDELAPLAAAGGESLDSLFAPPSGAKEQGWCANFTPATEINNALDKTYPAPRPGRVAVHIIIGTDGHVRDAYMLESMDLATDADARNAAKHSLWRAAKCGDIPVEEEKVVQIHFLVRHR